MNPINFSALLRRLVFISLTAAAIFGWSTLAWARVTRIMIEQKQSPAYDGKSFGGVGQYEILSGRVRRA